MGSGRLEIERKWLLAAPPSDAELRALGAEPISIEQVYLLGTPEAPVRRIRRSERAGRVGYTYTEKRLVAGIVRVEGEQAINAAEYARLLEEADPTRGPIRKTRHVFAFAGDTLELDVFDRPPGLCVLEIEFDRSDPPEPELPACLRVLRDVSEDPAYLNVTLARSTAEPGG